MDFKRLNPAKRLVSHCHPIVRLERLDRSFELLIQRTEDLISMRDSINEEITKELIFSKAPTLKCKKWLEKVGEIERSVNSMLEIKEKSSDLLRPSRTDLLGHLMSMVKEITDHLEKSPYKHGSMAYVPPGKSKITTNPILRGDAYGLAQEDKNVNLQRRAEAQGEANVKIGMSPIHGKEAVEDKEKHQGKHLTIPATTSRAASISDRKSLQSFASAGETINKSKGQTEKVPSRDEGGQTSPKLTKKLSKPTINQAEVEIPSQNEGGKALLEPRVNAGRSIEQVVLEILEFFNDATTIRIAIHGTGGIGKTSVLKALINHFQCKSLFDVIIWVTVSRHWSTRKIQNEVSRQLSLCLPDSESDSKVAKKLVQALYSRKFLFLLDDVWERVDLNAVGIPDMSSRNGCRMILTTSILDVCTEMSVNRVIEMKPVRREAAWELFHEQVGALADSPEIQPYAPAIVQECGGLPLLIIVTGRALAGVNDALVWKHALMQLLLPSTLGTYGAKAVVQRLKFSYDSLKACDIKSCFLYCALFSEEQEANISELVKNCFQEGLISGNWEDACKRGHEIVDILVDAFLLQSTKDGIAVKMHDVVRDLASMIILSKQERFQFFLRPYSRLTRPSNSGISSLYRPLENPESNGLAISEAYQFLCRGGAGWREAPLKEEWEKANMIALRDTELSSLPENLHCPHLLMLLLQRNRHLRVIPTSFFECMPSLEILNLSNTRIKFLPHSILKLKALKMLILRNCERLVVLPPEVGYLQDLEVLDLQGTEVNKLPDEIGILASLRHLEVSFYGSISPCEYAKLPNELLSCGIMSKLISLETLRIDVSPGDLRWKNSVESITTEVCSLQKLTALNFCFPEVELLKLFLQTCSTWHKRLLTNFKFVVGYDVKRIVSRVPNYVVVDYNQHGQCLRFVNGEKVPDAVIEVLTRTVAFYLDHHLSIRSLSEFGVSNFNGLELCIVSECTQIQSIVDDTRLTEIVFPFLEHLSIHYLWNLQCIWKGTIPYGSFAKLRTLLVHSCPKLRFVFTKAMLLCLSNLEELVVEDCPAIEAITLRDEIIDSEMFSLLNLKRLILNHLPGLVNIWEGAWPSLEYISLYECPNWKTVAMNSKVKVLCKED